MELPDQSVIVFL